MTLEPLLWLHCSISGRCLLEHYRLASPPRLVQYYLLASPDCVKSLRSSFTGLYPQTRLVQHYRLASPLRLVQSQPRGSEIEAMRE